MSTGQVILTQYSDNIAYCRFWDNSAGPAAFLNYDTEATTVAGTEFELWAEAADWLYVGKATTFAYVGFRKHTAASGYAGFYAEYRNTGTYAVTAVNQGTKTFSIADDHASQFVDGSHFDVAGSTGNDGTYTVNGDATHAAGTTNIIVDQAIPSAVADGNIEKIWTVLDLKHNSVEDFTVSGYFAWVIPGDWASVEIDNTTAYWIRATQTTAAPTPAKAEHLMRNVTLQPPIHSDKPERTVDLTYRDINGGIQVRDVTYKGPDRYVCNVTQVACPMDDVQLLLDWEYEQVDVYIEDGAATTPISFSADAYYRTMQGKLVSVPLPFASPGKMGLSSLAYYPLVFKIDTVTTLSSSLGLSL